MVKRSREDNLALYDRVHDKEAIGLKWVRELIKNDARLMSVKCAEGARPDFCVHYPEQEHRAKGLQLKTAFTMRRRGSAESVSFGHTNGYDGLLLLMIDFTGVTPRIWMLPGELVKTPYVYIGHSTYPSKWTKYERTVDNLVDTLCNVLDTPDSLAHVDDIVYDTRSPTRRREYQAYFWLRRFIPLDHKEPEVEHRTWDIEVLNTRWQLKLARWDTHGDRFRVNLDKSAGLNPDSKGQRHLSQQYAVDDFDFLAILLPYESEMLKACPPMFFLIPIQELAARGLVGAAGSGSGVKLYPHRAFGFSSWSAEYAVDCRTLESAHMEIFRIMDSAGSYS